MESWIKEIHVDENNKIVTTPAYMCDTKVHEIHDGVGKMVQAVLKLIWCSIFTFLYVRYGYFSNASLKKMQKNKIFLTVYVNI